MKDRKQIVDEINREKHLRPGLKRTISMIGMSLVMVVLLMVSLIFKEWVDAHGHEFGVSMLMLGLFCFAYWALLGRKK